MCHLNRPHSLRIWFPAWTGQAMFVSTNTAVCLTFPSPRPSSSLKTSTISFHYARPSHDKPAYRLLGFGALLLRLRDAEESRHRHFTRCNDHLFSLYSPFKAHTAPTQKAGFRVQKIHLSKSKVQFSE